MTAPNNRGTVHCWHAAGSPGRWARTDDTTPMESGGNMECAALRRFGGYPVVPHFVRSRIWSIPCGNHRLNYIVGNWFNVGRSALTVRCSVLLFS
jgi:hypothetical protein